MEFESSEETRERDTRAFEELLYFAAEAQTRVERLKFQAVGSAFGAAIAGLAVTFGFLPTAIDLFYFGESWRSDAALVAGLGIYVSFILGFFVYIYFRKRIQREQRALSEIGEVIDETYTLLSAGLTPVERAKAKVVMSRLY